MDQKTLYLIDGHSYLYRAFHALPPFTNSKGLPTNAVYGFTTMLQKILREKFPNGLAVIFDSEKPTYRHIIFKEYKSHRPQMPEALSVQIPYVYKLLDAYRIPVLVQEGVEADDLLATLAAKAQSEGVQVVLVSSDRDLFQVVSPMIQIYDSMRDKVFGVEEVHERFGVDPGRVIEVRGLAGDPSDNLPGVPGIGEKTAMGLIRQFGTIEGLLSRLEEVKGKKLQGILREYGGQARMSRDLAKLRQDIPWEGEIIQLERAEPDTQALVKVFTEMEFSGLLKALVRKDLTIRPSPDRKGDITPSEFLQLALKKREVGLAASLSDPLPMRADLVGIAFSCGNDKSLFLQTDLQSMDFIRRILEDPGIRKVGHDFKPLLVALSRIGVGLEGIYFDTMLGSYLLSPNRRSHELVDICVEYLDRAVMPRAEHSPEEMARTFCEAGEAVLEISTRMIRRLEERDQQRLYREVELPLINALAGMESHGVHIDGERLNELSKELDLQRQALTQKIFLLAGGEFNLNSPKQLSEVLFKRLGLKPTKKTKTGYSTNEEVLLQLAGSHELPAEILEYRQLTKIQSTYVQALPQMIHPQTGRLHTTFHQAVTATGRLSSREPNLQNIPVRGEWGRRIRQAFIAQTGYRLLSSDYNQIELRLLAHLSEDGRLVRAFREGVDIHTATAASLFKQPVQGVTTEMRRAAKTVNFGVIYGMGPYALSQELGTSQEEAREYIENYFREYCGVKQFVDRTTESARRTGYVSTLMGRRREVPEISAQNVVTRKLGERIAVNTVIQGSAADLMKLAMIGVFEGFKEAGIRSKMLLQIHDELIFEVCEEELERVKTLVREQMEGVLSLSVPIVVDLGLGTNWAELH